MVAAAPPLTTGRRLAALRQAGTARRLWEPEERERVRRWGTGGSVSGMAEGRMSGSGLAWGSAQFLSTFLLSPFLGGFERGLEGTRLWTEGERKTQRQRLKPLRPDLLRNCNYSFATTRRRHCPSCTGSAVKTCSCLDTSI